MKIELIPGVPLKILADAINHFERCTGLRCGTVKLQTVTADRMLEYTEVHDLDERTVAYSKQCPNYFRIVIREDKVCMQHLLHELAHQFHYDHNDSFYKLLEQCGFVIGKSIGIQDYRYETFST